MICVGLAEVCILGWKELHPPFSSGHGKWSRAGGTKIPKLLDGDLFPSCNTKHELKMFVGNKSILKVVVPLNSYYKSYE